MSDRQRLAPGPLRGAGGPTPGAEQPLPGADPPAAASENPLLAATPAELRVLQRVLAAMRQVRYGYVQVILQDGRPVQVDRLEKERLT